MVFRWIRKTRQLEAGEEEKNERNVACTEKRNEGRKIRSRSRYTVRVDLNPSICPTTNVLTSTLQLPEKIPTAISWPSTREQTGETKLRLRPTIRLLTLLVMYVLFLLFPLFSFFFLIETERLLRSIEKQLKRNDGALVHEKWITSVRCMIQWSNIWNSDKVQKYSISNKAHLFLILSLILSRQ